jgi:hypothetical protein
MPAGSPKIPDRSRWRRWGSSPPASGALSGERTTVPLSTTGSCIVVSCFVSESQ